MGAEAVEAVPEAMEVAEHLGIAEESMVANKTCSSEVDGINQLRWKHRKAFFGEEVLSL